MNLKVLSNNSLLPGIIFSKNTVKIRAIGGHPIKNDIMTIIKGTNFCSGNQNAF